VLVEETSAADAPEGLVALRVRASGAEKAVLALADAFEREPALRIAFGANQGRVRGKRPRERFDRGAQRSALEHRTHLRPRLGRRCGGGDPRRYFGLDPRSRCAMPFGQNARAADRQQRPGDDQQRDGDGHPALGPSAMLRGGSRQQALDKARLRGFADVHRLAD
jgi:hypothetical protein